jgi:hypothetical protein
MRRIHLVSIAAAPIVALLLGCESAPRARPVKGGPVDTGLGSMESVRRQLQGTWELTTLQLFSPAGQPIPATATGRLKYDEYGNLSMQGTVNGPDVDSSVLNLSGRAAIDPVAHTLKFEAISAKTLDDKRIDPQLDAKRVRYYEFVGDLLKTTIKSPQGATTATATWKRVE